MGFAIELTNVMSAQEGLSNAQYELMMYSSELTQLTIKTQAIVEEQSAAGQAYMAEHKDQEGEVDISAIEYVNSSAFNSRWDSQLKALQAKEQLLTMRKEEAQRRVNTFNTLLESWKKGLDSGVKMFGYFK